LVIDVEESWYIYPVPFAELKDKSWDKFSYGFDLYLKNFRGRNQAIRLRLAFGYDPSFYMNYTVPSLTSDGNYYFFTDLVFRDIRNKSRYAYSLAGNDFDQRMISGNAGLGRRFGIFHRVSLNAGFTYIENPVFIPGISASRGRIDRFPSAGLNYIYDTRDLAQFPRDGILFNSGVAFKGFGINHINYQILNLDFREYRPLIGDLFGKWRIAGRFGFGNLIPTYDFSYLGFGERIRGFYSTEMEGHHLYLASAEIYYPLVKDFQVNLDFIPIIPKELLHYRVGMFLQLFTDTGTTKLRGSNLGIRDFASGYGAGITFLILPYNIMRVEFALNEDGLNEWILDLGISF
jgi:outer membrane protein assembly factor BamA